MSAKLLTLTELQFDYDGAPDSGNRCPRCNQRMMWQEDAGANYRRTGEGPRFMDCEECELRCDTDTGQVYQVTHEKSCSCEECHAGDYDPNNCGIPLPGM